VPEQDGWHTIAFTSGGKQMRWHYCAASPRDTLVEDTPAARAAHERECLSKQQKVEEARRREARERSLAALKAASAEKQLERSRA